MPTISQLGTRVRRLRPGPPIDRDAGDSRLPAERSPRTDVSNAAPQDRGMGSKGRARYLGKVARAMVVVGFQGSNRSRDSRTRPVDPTSMKTS